MQGLLLALAVPEHTPVLLHVSGLVHSLLSLQLVPGVQLPVQAPLTHACDTHCLHVPLAPPPHIAVVWLDTATHVVPLQQPVGHEVASHTQTPPEQRCPVPHVTQVAPQVFAGQAQMPAPEQTCPVEHGIAVGVAQAPAPLQVAGDRDVVEFWQVAEEHVVALPGNTQAVLVPLQKPA